MSVFDWCGSRFECLEAGEFAGDLFAGKWRSKFALIKLNQTG